MSGPVEVSSQMTGSTRLGPPQGPKNSTMPLPAQPPKSDQHQTQPCKMNIVSTPEQPIQLTPLWEHVVHTRRFPSSVDTASIFREISERLRDPEWEVRQHALRVLVDVVPALENNVIDTAMVPVLPELVSNLGHPAPAVRKGALDTLRVYLCYSQDKEIMLKNILNLGLNRPDALDNFQTNVTLGVILSVPSLLFPSPSSPRPPSTILKYSIMALASRLVQVTHQEAALRSLAKIRETIGAREFDSYLLDYNVNVKRDFEILCDVYNVKASKDNADAKQKSQINDVESKDLVPSGQAWGTDSDSSGSTEDIGSNVHLENGVVSCMPPARVVLETEIKFNEATAITMTILEEKGEDSDAEDLDDGTESDESDLGVIKVLEDVPERRKTPRRVHFGGEVVKLRTPDSDNADFERVNAPKTRIPLPVAPATKMPLDQRRSMSQPSSPSHSKQSKIRSRRSLSSSPRREVHTYNANLSPKKSILSRTNSPLFIIQSTNPQRTHRKLSRKKKVLSSSDLSHQGTNFKQIANGKGSFNSSSETKENDARMDETTSGSSSLFAEREKNIPPDNKELIQRPLQEFNRNSDASPKESPQRASSRASFESFPRQERNYILMELSSPVRKGSDERQSDDKLLEEEPLPFGSKVDINPSTPTETTSTSDQLVNKLIDVVQTSRLPQPVTSHVFGTPLRGNVKNTTECILSGASNSDKVVGWSESRTAELPLGKDKKRSGDTVSMETVIGKKTESLQESQQPAHPDASKDEISTDSSRSHKTTNRLDSRQRQESSTGAEKKGSDDVVSVTGKKWTLCEVASRGMEGNLEGRESVTCSSSEGEGGVQEPSWEELGLVCQEILDDLHNKDDWRSRVRGLERVASALRTSSALETIEPRLGSLLHSVLGVERSCRVAAAGLSVAKVVVSGVSEEALKRRLPQLAWGLTRQGGPHAAQLARIAMLRLRPALLLEQLLQPHCIGARSGKTRENTLQLLIFSLVTFPSTEFRVDAVAGRVAEAVGDRRRRVRQAALDTLAVLAQIYEPEEVLRAGERAAKGRPDGDAMMSAIGARLGRKSLPLVSADGLVVYGLQISPTVQIASGADVDWIVAGSGSVSPGSGRTRGQLIATTAKLDSETVSRNESVKNGGQPRTDLVAVGIGIGPKHQQPLTWRLVPVHKEDDHRVRVQSWSSDDQISNATIPNGLQHKIRSEESLQHRNAESSKIHDSIKRGSGETPNSQTNAEYLQKRIAEFRRENLGPHRFPIQNLQVRMRSPPTKKGQSSKLESRIPVPHSRDRIFSMKETSSGNLGRRGSARVGIPVLNAVITRRETLEANVAPEGGGYEREQREENIGYGIMYQRRRRLMEENSFQTLHSQNGPNYAHQSRYDNQVLTRERPDQSSTNIRTRVDVARDVLSQGPKEREQLFTSFNLGHRGLSKNRESTGSPDRTRRRRSRSRSEEHRHESIPRTTHSTSQTPPRETYGTMYQRRRRLIEGNAFRALQSSQNVSNDYSHKSSYTHHTQTRRVLENVDNGIRSRADVGLVMLGMEATDQISSSTRRRSRSRSRSTPNRESTTRTTSHFPQMTHVHKIDKAPVDDEECNGRRHSPVQTSVYPIQNFSSDSSQYQGDDVRSSSATSSTSIISVDETKKNNKIKNSVQHVGDNTLRNSSSSSQQDKHENNNTFSIVELPSNTNPHDSIDSYVISVNTKRSNTPMGSIAVELAETDSSSVDGQTMEDSDDLSNQDEISHDVENLDENETVTDNITEHYRLNRNVFSKEPDDFLSSHLSKLSDDSLNSTHSSRPSQGTQSTASSENMLITKKSSDSIFSDHSNKSAHSSSLAFAYEHADNNSQKSLETSLQKDAMNLLDEDEGSMLSAILLDDSNSVQSQESQKVHREADVEHLDERIQETNLTNEVKENISMSPELSNSKQSLEEINPTKDAVSFVPLPHIITSEASTFTSGKEGDNTVGEDLIEAKVVRSPSPSEPVEPIKRLPSRLPRNKPQPRVNSMRIPSALRAQDSPKPAEKPKAIAQLCFTQLESKDWEVTMKGLKTLSLIARQHPEQLEACSPGTIGRLLGRHIQNLRSQVSRVACVAASDMFTSQIKGIDQELDDIAGALLHRTADTNRFLRADCNDALDRMVENISPHRTISVFLHRGATHQNAIVRAATARLLSKVVERVGPEQAMALPRDVRDKLLGTGAKLLMDGNLDARNHAKRIFRGLARCDGFHKALKDAVPETTLRHIDKTMKSL